MRFKTLPPEFADRVNLDDLPEVRKSVARVAQEQEVAKASKERWERHLARDLKTVLPHVTFEPEYMFHVKRQWRLDFAQVDRRIAIEVEGGLWQIGRHQRPEGFMEDCVKYNALVLDRWWLLRFPPEHIKSGEAIATVEALIEAIDARID